MEKLIIMMMIQVIKTITAMRKRNIIIMLMLINLSAQIIGRLNHHQP